MYFDEEQECQDGFRWKDDLRKKRPTIGEDSDGLAGKLEKSASAKRLRYQARETRSQATGTDSGDGKRTREGSSVCGGKARVFIKVWLFALDTLSSISGDRWPLQSARGRGNRLGPLTPPPVSNSYFVRFPGFLAPRFASQKRSRDFLRYRRKYRGEKEIHLLVRDDVIVGWRGLVVGVAQEVFNRKVHIVEYQVGDQQKRPSWYSLECLRRGDIHVYVKYGFTRNIQKSYVCLMVFPVSYFQDNRSFARFAMSLFKLTSTPPSSPPLASGRIRNSPVRWRAHAQTPRSVTDVTICSTLVASVGGHSAQFGSTLKVSGSGLGQAIGHIVGVETPVRRFRCISVKLGHRADRLDTYRMIPTSDISGYQERASFVKAEKDPSIRGSLSQQFISTACWRHQKDKINIQPMRGRLPLKELSDGLRIQFDLTASSFTQTNELFLTKRGKGWGEAKVSNRLGLRSPIDRASPLGQWLNVDQL
ncbi:hypothetical protein ACRALDRAFT_207583 [Sodiomyces alcalophilus JCM 7366]|uniref:uncharacterized protein n=1 Tax=Sodiomyces alcalophilus JCM 7366 TaxID=591952 RepID=UPI0039B65A53